jgi:ABC-type antimicrobial peptide transport system permease subunit
VREPRLFFRLLGGFAAFALLLAAIGVYGVLAYVTGTRRREFGVRLALGAVAGQIQRQVIMQALRPVLIGALAGMVTAVALSRLIAGLLYGVAPTSPVVHLVTLTILIGVGVAASWWPARRAARLDPAVVLQAE